MVWTRGIALCTSTIERLRQQYQQSICSTILGFRQNSDALTVADVSSSASKLIAFEMARRMGWPLAKDPKEGQTAGKLFTDYTEEFLRSAFSTLTHLRPGSWLFSVSQAAVGIAAFDQYEHLAELNRVLASNPDLQAALGREYLITPDIVVARQPVEDEEINADGQVVEGANVARLTPLRRANNPKGPILHASISCKWTIRSDRVQNTRTEALNLIRNRKGNSPHIVAVTLEPLPSRLASIALGTGDIDCTYHGALYELQEAVKATGNEDQADVLNMLLNGRRLRDISDLPFDLAI